MGIYLPVYRADVYRMPVHRNDAQDAGRQGVTQGRKERHHTRRIQEQPQTTSDRVHRTASDPRKARQVLHLVLHGGIRGTHGSSA